MNLQVEQCSGKPLCTSAERVPLQKHVCFPRQVSARRGIGRPASPTTSTFAAAAAIREKTRSRMASMKGACLHLALENCLSSVQHILWSTTCSLSFTLISFELSETLRLCHDNYCVKFANKLSKMKASHT